MINEQPQYQPLFKRIAEGIVYKPKQMRIDETETHPGNITLFVKVHIDDIGLLCGKQCNTLKAIQQIFREIGEKKGQVVRISVSTDEHGVRQPAPRYQEKGDWSRSEDAKELVNNIVEALGFGTPKIDIMDRHDSTVLVMDSRIDERLFEATRQVLYAWGKSLGRNIFLIRPDKVRTTPTR